MNCKELIEILNKENIHKNWYSINDFLLENAYNFREIHNSYWEVFYIDEKGNHKDYIRFSNESEACNYLLDKILKEKKEFEVWEKNKKMKSDSKISNLTNNKGNIYYVKPNGDIYL